ncbi:hypothetical protein FRC04_012261 [Tulasnella sp. 424]|nr:hypothetical protein FRC04_012261 [Tulasnella sp. 424]KAG8970913.1 hypothetical protein FRC05_011681 [Tulasnella sp. 425]
MSTLNASTATKWPTRLLRRPGHPSPVVRALGIDEIIRYILSFISERGDLHALLFVCKSFYVPALDRLWEVIPNLSPLFGILPKDAIDFMVEKNCEGKLFYKYKLLNGRARRVLKSYCRRVKQISALELRDIDMRAVRALIGCLGLPITAGSPSRRVSDDLPSLFPNLLKASISIDPLKPSHGDILAHLCSPRLEELQIQLKPFRRLVHKPASASRSRLGPSVAPAEEQRSNSIASIGQDDVFPVAGPSETYSSPEFNTTTMPLEDLASLMAFVDRTAKLVASIKETIELEARRKAPKPRSPTDDVEDWQLAPAFGEKAHAAAVRMRSPLHTVTIDISESTDDGIVQLESLCTIPTLREVCVKGDLASSIHAYALLRYLGANPALEHVSSAPTAFIASAFAIDNPDIPLGDKGWFPALQSFEGYNDSLTRIVAASSGCFSSLKKIHISFSAATISTPQAGGGGDPLSQRLRIQRFIDFVGSRCCALEDITLWALWDIDGEEGPISLRGLSNCSQMRRLVFDGPDPSMNPPTDDDIAAMAEAWPLLETLHWQGAAVSRAVPEELRVWRGYSSFGQLNESDHRPNATLKSLAKLSQLCRYLKEVEIDVDCQEDLASGDLIEALPELERITVWRWHLTLRDVARTAAVIAALAGPYKPDSTLKKARDWITSGVSRNEYEKLKLWDEVFAQIDGLRGVPDELGAESNEEDQRERDRFQAVYGKKRRGYDSKGKGKAIS